MLLPVTQFRVQVRVGADVSVARSSHDAVQLYRPGGSADDEYDDVLDDVRGGLEDCCRCRPQGHQ